MKKLMFLLVACGTFTLASGAHAEERLSLPEFQIGLGAALGHEAVVAASEDSSFLMLPVSFANFYVPMIISRQILLEPEFGYLRFSNDSSDVETSTDLFRFGLGIFYSPLRGRTALHFGMRFGLVVNSSSASMGSVGQEDSKTDFFIGPAVGAEYFFSEQFSLGAEVQINYISPGKWDNTTGQAETTQSLFSNRTSIFARFYFLPGEDTIPEALAEPRRMDLPQPPPPVPSPRPAQAERLQPAQPARPAEPVAQAEPVVPDRVETPPAPDCPEGALLQGGPPPQGYEQYCAVRDAKGNWIKHGWYRTWYDTGKLASSGEYLNGKRQGPWQFFYNDGSKRLQGEYRDDRQEGRWTTWSRKGQVEKEVEYRDGQEVK